MLLNTGCTFRQKVLQHNYIFIDDIIIIENVRLNAYFAEGQMIPVLKI